MLSVRETSVGMVLDPGDIIVVQMGPHYGDLPRLPAGLSSGGVPDDKFAK